MTCIIATRRFVCADRRVSEDGGASGTIIKVAKNPWLIAAAAGHACANVAVKREIRAGAQHPSDLLDCVDAGSYALVLTWDGVLSMISEGLVWPVTERVAAIGSGADMALGYMRGDDSRELARLAQRFVAKRRVDCGGGCDIRGF